MLGTLATDLVPSCCVTLASALVLGWAGPSLTSPPPPTPRPHLVPFLNDPETAQIQMAVLTTSETKPKLYKACEAPKCDVRVVCGWD